MDELDEKTQVRRTREDEIGDRLYKCLLNANNDEFDTIINDNYINNDNNNNNLDWDYIINKKIYRKHHSLSFVCEVSRMANIHMMKTLINTIKETDINVKNK